MAVTTRRFSTGLPFLDRRIGGGIAAGGLLALTAPPASQSELLLAQLLSTRRTAFVSTVRPEREVREWIDAKTDAEVEVTVTAAGAEELLDDPETATEPLAPESLLIVDPTDGLEAASRDRYLDFVNHLKRQLRDTDSVGVLHCIDRDESPPRRGLTLHRADHVWQLQVLVLSREIKTRLLVTKARRGQALTEPIPLLLTDRVRIDTSRRIA